MYKTLPCYLMALTLMLHACNTNSPGGNTSNSVNSDSTNPAVETKAPNTEYKSVFAGQTRISGVKTSTPYEGVVLTNDLKKPWGIAILPDGRLLITEKGGAMRIVSASGSAGTSITGLPAVNDNGQGGLLGLTIDPSFSGNRMVYWTFSEKTSDGNLTSVAKGKLSADEKTIENATVIYRATPGYNGNLHYGGRIIFDKNGNLFVSTGERSDLETRAQAQDLNSALGKILHITTDGKPAAGNPFLNTSNARPEIYSYGHRNVQGLAFHPETGDLWGNEFGPRGGDELNLIQPGKNYGWPIITYGIEYSGGKVGGAITQKDGMEQPVYYWDPSLSPSGMIFYNSDQIPEWKNNLFIAGLNSNYIARLVIQNNKVVGEEKLLADQKQRFRDVVQSKDGALYTITDGGRLYRISKK